MGTQQIRSAAAALAAGAMLLSFGCSKPNAAPANSASSNAAAEQSSTASSSDPAVTSNTPGPTTSAASVPPPFSKADKQAAAGTPTVVARNDSSAPADTTKASSLVPQKLVIPAGTPIAVRLQQSLSSATATSGETFAAVLDEPLVVNGQTIAPKGADVSGHVVSARRSGHLHSPGFLRIALDAIHVNGREIAVQSSSVSVQGASFKKRNWSWIGGSTAGGALIGGLAGGGKGALIGSLVGAGGGTTAAYVTGHKDVGFAAERRLTFRLTQPLEVS